MIIRKTQFIYLALLLSLYSCQPGKMTKEELTEKINEELKKQEGTYAVAFKDLSTGEELLIKEHTSFHAASTMKTPVMIEVYKQVSEGKFSLSDSIEVKNEFKSIVDGSPYKLDSSDDSEHALYTKTGSKRQLSELVYDMIIVSSNLATNIIIELVDAKKVNGTMRSMGANDIQVLRGVEDSKAFQKGLNNSTTAYDLMLIFEKMAKGETVSQNASTKMIATLMDQRFNDIIPSKLPKDVKVAHKTGSITGVHHDSGIVFLPDGRKYVLVILSKDLKDDKKATGSMAEVSKMIYEYVTSKTSN